MKQLSMDKLKVVFVIPAYNEEKMIGTVVHDLRKALKRKKYHSDIVVVDDGSKDNTAAVAVANGATVIQHILNTGSGGATATGLRHAEQNNYDMAVTLDADGQHLIEDVLKGPENLAKKKVDVLIGSRLLDSDGMSRVKVLGNWGLSTITNILFGIRVTDSQSGLRIFSKKAIKQLKWKSSGFEFCSEMLWRANQQKLVIDEYPITAVYTEYSMSKGQNNWNAVNIIKSLLQRRVTEIFGE